MNLVGILRCTNEEDWIEELMGYHTREIHSIYFLDDSTDHTGEIVRGFSEVIWFRRVEELAREMGTYENEANFEWVRQIVIEQILKDWGVGTWIWMLHGDEANWHCMTQITQQAEYMGRNAILLEPMHFFLGSSQRDNWDSYWAKLPVLERLRFYCPGSSNTEWRDYEMKAVKLSEDMYYTAFERYRYVPHLGQDDAYRTAPPPHPLYIHAGWRSPAQCMDRVRRNFETGFQPVHRGLLDKGPFVDCLDGYSEVCEWNGKDFGKRDRPDLYTYLECGHKRGGV